MAEKVTENRDKDAVTALGKSSLGLSSPDHKEQPIFEAPPVIVAPLFSRDLMNLQ